MEWIEVFVATSQMGLEPVEGVLYQCGLNGLMIHDEADFAGGSSSRLSRPGCAGRFRPGRMPCGTSRPMRQFL